MPCTGLVGCSRRARLRQLWSRAGYAPAMDLMRRLRPFLLVTDTLFLAYWAVTSLVALKVLAVPEA